MISNNYAVKYYGQSKKDVLNEHIQNYQKLAKNVDQNIIDEDTLTDYVQSHS